jgi:hypothetical protein
VSSFQPIPEQPEHVPGRPIAWILGATVLVIATCAVIVWTLQMFAIEGGGRSRVETIEILPPAQPFSERLQPEQARQAEHEALDAWSWIDRPSGRVRLPIDVAIDRYIQQRGGR